MKTVSFKLAKELKETGFPQDTYMHWQLCDFPFSEEILIHTDFKKDSSLFAAPTADEILDLLPEEVVGDEGMRFDLNIYKGEGNMWVVCYWWDEDSGRKSGMFIKNVVDKSLANAAAKQWLYLKKWNLFRAPVPYDYEKNKEDQNTTMDFTIWI